jgi:hypothetical protein
MAIILLLSVLARMVLPKVENPGRCIVHLEGGKPAKKTKVLTVSADASSRKAEKYCHRYL